MADSSFSNFLLNGQPPANITTGTSQVGSLPAWYNSYLSSLATTAANIASSPYQTYGGARIAPLDPQQQQAYDYLGANATNWQSPLQTAQSAATGVAGGFNAGQFGQYMSPYIGGVVNEIERLGLQNMNENLLPTLNSQFVDAGQFGSTRHGDLAERLVRDVGANISGQQGLALQGAHQNAMQNYLQGQGQVNQAAQNLGNLSGLQQAQTIGTAGALSASGQTMQQQGQANLDLGYQDWLNQINYPRQNVSFLSSALQGANIPTSQTRVESVPGGSYTASPLGVFSSALLSGLSGLKVAKGGYIGDGPPLAAVARLRSPMRRRPASGAGMRGAGGLERLRLAA